MVAKLHSPVKWSHLPVALPGGTLVPHMDARDRALTIRALWEASGGFERALAWIEESPDNYKEFFKIWAKGAVRSTNVEVGVSEGVEALLEKLDTAERAKIINGEFTEVASDA